MTGEVRSVFTDIRHGDLMVRTDPAVLAARRAAIVDRPWSWLRQVHGAGVIAVSTPGEHAGAEADAAVTRVPGAVLAVQTADCAPILLTGPGVIGVAHAGWRGLEAGVIEATAAAMAELGGAPERATLGPCIRARCYEFGGADLDLVAARYGDAVRATTAWGTPALDVAAGIAEALRRLDIAFDDVGTCTACSPVHWSHRARSEPERQALVAWIEP
ncbi:polyphenol oxidase family protein [Aquihabitans daechungensis]|uniref:polyphenol oxidase family protein n=1 Tax=Aquihabitans daechungensis TaxID=1052257 RepID=UPI003BA17DE2